LDKVKEIVRRQMENSIKLDVPLKVDIACGKNWSDMA
jgi:DNA polymerase I-like protein with 3'-5' exonuclease and polymerase domains